MLNKSYKRVDTSFSSFTPLGDPPGQIIDLSKRAEFVILYQGRLLRITIEDITDELEKSPEEQEDD